MLKKASARKARCAKVVRVRVGPVRSGCSITSIGRSEKVLVARCDDWWIFRVQFGGFVTCFGGFFQRTIVLAPTHDTLHSVTLPPLSLPFSVSLLPITCVLFLLIVLLLCLRSSPQSVFFVSRRKKLKSSSVFVSYFFLFLVCSRFFRV